MASTFRFSNEGALVGILVLVILGSMALGCKDSSFSASTSSEPGRPSGNVDIADGRQGPIGQDDSVDDPREESPRGSDMAVGQNFSDFFKLSENIGEVDILVAVDQSRSMPEEIQIVKDNLVRFQKIVAAKTNVKLGLFGSPSGPVGADMFESPYIDQFKNHFPVLVKSHDSLEKFLEFYATGTETAGGQKVKAEQFYRNGTLKIYLVVTDEDALFRGDKSTDNLSPEELAEYFKLRIDKLVTPGSLKVYAFAGKSSSSCGAKTPGRVYEYLAKLMESKVYDICSSDWTVPLEDLASQIITGANQRFKLTHSVDQIIAVLLGNETLSEEDYQLDGNVLVLKKMVEESQSGQELRVYYR